MQDFSENKRTLNQEQFVKMLREYDLEGDEFIGEYDELLDELYEGMKVTEASYDWKAKKEDPKHEFLGHVRLEELKFRLESNGFKFDPKEFETLTSFYFGRNKCITKKEFKRLLTGNQYDLEYKRHEVFPDHIQRKSCFKSGRKKVEEKTDE